MSPHAEEAMPIEEFLPPDPAAREIATRRRHHWEMLTLALFVLVACYLLQVLPNGRVAVIGLPQYPLPHSCVSYRLFQFSCPGCGLTRSFIYLTHGRLSESLAIHPLGWLVAVAVFGQIPYRLVALRRADARWGHPRLLNGIAVTLLCLLIINWAWNLALYGA